MAKIESTGGHIKIMLVIEITKIKLTGGHIDNMVLFWWFTEIIRFYSIGIVLLV